MSYKNGELQMGTRGHFKRAGVRKEVKRFWWKAYRQKWKHDPENAPTRKRYRFWFD